MAASFGPDNPPIERMLKAARRQRARHPRAFLAAYVAGILIVLCAVLAGFAWWGGENTKTMAATRWAVNIQDSSKADTQAGVVEGQRIGSARHNEGFARPPASYVDQLTELVNSDRSPAWKTGFKAGYLSAWENHGEASP